MSTSNDPKDKNRKREYYVADGRIRKSWPSAAFGGTLRSINSRTKGLINPGLQCYRNAVLQCLLHNPEFFRYLDRADRCATPGDGCVFCALRDLAQQYWSSTEIPDPQQVVTRVNTAMEMHKSRNPEDSQAYGFMQPAWSDSLNQDLGVQIYDMNTSGQQDAHEYFLGVLNMLKHTNKEAKKAAINRLFRVRCKATWTCKDCGKIHVRREKDLGLNLAIPRKRNQWTPLEDCIDAHFADETLEGVECDSAVCRNRKRTRIRTTRIVGGPEILVIQLMRMRYSNGQMKKVKSPIDYEERLDLSEWCNGPLKYQLNGIVAHSGPTLTEGHYVSMVRCQNGTDFAYCNDDSVIDEPKQKERVLQYAESKAYQSYLLVYQKIGGKMAKRV